jgi:phytoene synthase
VSALGASPPRPGSARYFCWLYSPASTRERIACLFALEREVGASLRPGLEHEVAHLRLDWWQEELARLAMQRPVHPLTRALLQAAHAAGMTAPDLHGLIEAARWDLAAGTAASRAELAPHFGEWADSLFRALIATLLPGEPAAQEHLVLGGGVALAELEGLAFLARDARAGRLRLPLDELDAAGCTPASLATPPWPRGLATILADRHASLRASLAGACAALAPAQQAPLRGVLAWFALAAQQSQREVRALPRPCAAHRLDAFSAAWRAWRYARRATLGRLSLNEDSQG